MKLQIDRILHGLFPGSTDPHESDPVEVVMSVECEPGMLYDTWYATEKLKQVRKAYGIKGPGSAILHTHLSEPFAYCPEGDHFHLFLANAPTARGMVPAVTLGPVRKPALRDCLRVSKRPRSANMRYTRGKWVKWIRWFGRRGAARLARNAEGKPVRPGKVRHCQLCAKDVPFSEWSRRVSRTEVLSEEGWFERPWTQLIPVTWREER